MTRGFVRSVLLLACSATLLAGCLFQDGREPDPLEPSVNLPEDRFEPPVSFTTPLEIDFPDDPPRHYFDDRLLTAAVWRADGRVHMGFKRPELPKLPYRAVRRAEGRRVTIEAIDASQILEALRFLVAQGAEITMQYHSFPAIAPEAAARIRKHPLVDFVEPVTNATLGAVLPVTPSDHATRPES